MINVMRKHHKVLMIAITGLVCISFSWYWNRTDFAQMGNATVGKIYDHPVSQIELQRNVRLLRLASELGMRDLAQELTIGAQSQSEAEDSFSWNLMILRHEAEQLGIEPTTAEIAEAVKALPAFRTEKGFDLERYNDLVDHALAPMGFSQAQVEELAADQIALERVKKILSAGVSVPETEMRHDFEQAYGKMEVSVVRFHPDDFVKDAQVTDDLIAKYFASHKTELKTEEKRKVKLVQFGLSEEEKKLTGKARIEVLQKLADKADEFTDALQVKGADFDRVAAKFKLTPMETGAFSKNTPDPALKGTPQLAQAAFSLTKEAPNSDAIQTPDGFDLLHLVQVEPSRPLTKEEARPQIVEALKKQEVQQMVAMKAADVASKLREDLGSGKTVEQAATDAGVKAERLPAFALVDTLPGATPAPTPEAKSESPDMKYIKQAASNLSPGGVSDYMSTPQGGLLVVLDKREEIGPEQFEKSRGALEEEILTNKGQLVFYEWLRDRRRAAGMEETKTQHAPG
ncbi:MAG: SurA N-terminal domain-containing protein [Chthoniobacterales bacterium]